MKSNFKICFNVVRKINGENDICLHRTLKGAKKCQGIGGGEIIKEKCDIYLYKEIEQ